MITIVDNIFDVFAAEVQYHKSCWKNYTRLLCDDDHNSHIHNVEILEAKKMFLKHVQKVNLELQEPRTLQGLAEDYKTVLHNFGFSTNSLKSEALKTLIQKEFEDDVRFHLQHHRNQSTLVYDNRAGGDCIEAAIYSCGCKW